MSGIINLEELAHFVDARINLYHEDHPTPPPPPPPDPPPDPDPDEEFPWYNGGGSIVTWVGGRTWITRKPGSLYPDG